jgi:hypothetical protein
MATTGTKVPTLVAIPGNIDVNLKRALESLREAQEIRLGRRGDPRDRAITLRELIDSGLAQELKDNPFDPNAGVGTIDFEPNPSPGDLTIPPAVTGLTASGAFTTIVLSWDQPQFGNFAYAEIYRSPDSSFSNAQRRDTTTASVYSDSVDYDSTYYYWVRFVSTSDVEGPFGSSVNATTVENIEAVMTNLSEDLTSLPGYSIIQGDIAAEASARASADATINSSISTLSSTVSGNTSSISTLSSTTSTINGNLNAMYVIQASTESNGSVSAAGMVIGSNATSGSGAQSYVQFQADKFAIWNGSSSTAPFIVSGGVVYIDDARIQNGAITNAKIGLLAVDNARIANGTITGAKIGSATIDTANITDAAITTAKIDDAQVTTLKIGANQVTVPSSSFASSTQTVNADPSLPAAGVTVTLQSLSMTVIASQPVFLLGSATIDLTSGSAHLGVKLYLYRDSTLLVTYNRSSTTTVKDIWTVPYVDTPSAGTYTYYLKVNFSPTSSFEADVLEASNRLLYALQTKR